MPFILLLENHFLVVVFDKVSVSNFPLVRLYLLDHPPARSRLKLFSDTVENTFMQDLTFSGPQTR